MESIMKIEPRYPDTLELLLGTGQAGQGTAVTFREHEFYKNSLETSLQLQFMFWSASAECGQCGPGHQCTLDLNVPMCLSRY